jgi:ribosomal-protein-alanine N-acetyltransferase
MPDTHGIRIALRGDATAIAQLSRDQIERGLGWRWTAPRVLRSILDVHSNVIVAPAAHGSRGELAGFGIMKYHDEEAHLLLLAVEPAVRRRGLGAALLGWLEASAQVAGIGTIYLEARASNGGARAFYRQLGYREIQQVEGYYSGREASVRIARDLWEPAQPPAAGRLRPG